MTELTDAPCASVLVDDSVGMVLHGLRWTLSVTMEMMILHGQAEAALAAEAARRTGALHDGHLSLVAAAKKRADRVIVTIFVNPNCSKTRKI